MNTGASLSIDCLLKGTDTKGEATPLCNNSPTTIFSPALNCLGIGGSFIATYAGQALGLYRAGEAARFIGAIVGAIIILFIYGFIAGRSR